MRLHAMKCPNCGGALSIKLDDKQQIFCPYCGEKFYVEDGKKEYTINQNIRIDRHTSHTRHIVNEADVIRAKNKEREQKMNCTPFVRQYDILSNKWGVNYAKRSTKQKVYARI